MLREHTFPTLAVGAQDVHEEAAEGQSDKRQDVQGLATGILLNCLNFYHDKYYLLDQKLVQMLEL